MALLDNTGFSSIFADTMDDDITFDNMFGAEEDDELMEFVLSDDNGKVIEPVFEDAEVDASGIEDESPDMGDVEGLAGPEINAKEIENECDKVNKESDELEEAFMEAGTDKRTAEDIKDQELSEAYDAALNSLLNENDSDVAVPNTSKEGPETMGDPGDIDEAFLAEDKSDIEKDVAKRLKRESDSHEHKKHQNTNDRYSQNYATTGQRDPSTRSSLANDKNSSVNQSAKGKEKADEINKKATKVYNTTSGHKEYNKESADLDEAFLGEECWDDTLKNEVDCRGKGCDPEMNIKLQGELIKPTVPSDAEGKNAGPDINAKEIEDEEGTAAEMDEAFLGEMIGPMGDTLKNDIDARPSNGEGPSMTTDLPQAPIVKPTVPSDAEGKNVGPDINAKEIEDEEGTESEFESAFFSEETDPDQIGFDSGKEDGVEDSDSDVLTNNDEVQELDEGDDLDLDDDNKDDDLEDDSTEDDIDIEDIESDDEDEIDFDDLEDLDDEDDDDLDLDEAFSGTENDTLKNDVDSRDKDDFSMDTDLPQAPIVKPTTPGNAEGKGDEELDASEIEDEAFLGECDNDTLKNDVDSRGKGCDPEMDTKLQSPIVKPTVPSDTEGKNAGPDINAKEIEDEEGTAAEMDEAFLGEESWDDTLKNDVDCRGKGCDPEMDVKLQGELIKPTTPSDAEGKNAGPDINAKEIEDEEGTDSEFDEAFFSEEVDKSVEANAEEPDEDIEDKLLDDAESKTDDLSDSMMDDLLADDDEDILLKQATED